MILIHRTTRHRAERILRDGPQDDYREPGGLPWPDGFSIPALRSDEAKPLIARPSKVKRSGRLRSTSPPDASRLGCAAVRAGAA